MHLANPAAVGATALAAALAWAVPVQAEPSVLTLKNHAFIPDHVSAPAGRKVQVVVVNQDGTPEEFESNDLHIEKLVAPYSRVSVTLGPLKPGTYGFFGDFHPQSAKGTLTVVAP